MSAILLFYRCIITQLLLLLRDLVLLRQTSRLANIYYYAAIAANYEKSLFVAVIIWRKKIKIFSYHFGIKISIHISTLWKGKKL